MSNCFCLLNLTVRFHKVAVCIGGGWWQWEVCSCTLIQGEGMLADVEPPCACCSFKWYISGKFQPPASGLHSRRKLMALPCRRELVFLIRNSDGLKPELLIPRIIDNNNYRSLLLMGFQQAVPDLLALPFHLIQICASGRQSTAK